MIGFIGTFLESGKWLSRINPGCEVFWPAFLQDFSSVLKQVSSFLLCPVVCKTAWFEVLSNKCKNKGECSRGKQTLYDMGNY